MGDDTIAALTILAGASPTFFVSPMLMLCMVLIGLQYRNGLDFDMTTFLLAGNLISLAIGLIQRMTSTKE